MKKSIFLGMMALALLFVIAGCGDPTTVFRQEPTALANPGNLTADVTYDGIVIVKWDSVNNASGYTVLRRDTETNATVQLVNNQPNLFYIDAVSVNNQLVNGRRYEYIVRSISPYSSAGAAFGPTIIQSGESRVTSDVVKAPDTFTPELAAGDISVTLLEGLTSDSILVKFPNKANLTYTIGYAYGKEEQIIREFTSTEQGNGAWYDANKQAVFPAFGGVSSVYVTAVHRSSAWYVDAIKVVKEVENITTVKVGLGSISNFNAARNLNAVSLTWSDVDGATSYSIYKASLSSSANLYFSPLPSLIVSSDWTAVTAVQDRQANGSWKAVDSLQGYSGNYAYAIVAEGANGKSSPAFAGVGPVASSAIQNSTLDPVVIKADKKIQLTWTADTSAIYILERAEVKSLAKGQEASLNNYQVVSAYDIVPTPAASYVQGRAVVIDTPPAENKNYIYKLSTSIGGVESAPSYQFLTTAEFSTVVSAQLIRLTGNNANAFNIDVAVDTSSLGSTFTGREYDLKLYRRVYSTAEETPYVEITAAAKKTHINTFTYVDTVDSLAHVYQYKIEAVGYDNTDGESSALYAYGADVLNNLQSAFTVGQVNNTANPVDIAGAGTTKLPGRSVIIGTGYVQTTPAANSGPNFNGLTIKVKFPITAAPGTASQDVTIARVPYVSGSTTTYYYYFTLPATVVSGTLYVVDGTTDWTLGSY